MKNSKFILHSLYLLKVFLKPRKDICYFQFYYVGLINESAYKKI